MITPEILRAAAEEAKTGSVPYVGNLLEQAASAIAALTAENARMREALEQVASHPNLSPLMVGFTNTITAKDLKQSLEDVREIARADIREYHTRACDRASEMCGNTPFKVEGLK